MKSEGLNNTSVISKDVPNEIIKLKEQGGKNILIFGSPALAQTLMQHNLIDSYWIFINPVIFGEGIPLFTGVRNKSKLTLLATKHFPNGELALNYVVDRN